MNQLENKFDFEEVVQDLKEIEEFLDIIIIRKVNNGRKELTGASIS